MPGQMKLYAAPCDLFVVMQQVAVVVAHVLHSRLQRPRRAWSAIVVPMPTLHGIGDGANPCVPSPHRPSPFAHRHIAHVDGARHLMHGLLVDGVRRLALRYDADIASVLGLRLLQR